MSTKIEWCDETINPLQDKIKGKSGRGYHCTKTSPGCLLCYSERINKIRGNGLPFDNRPVEFELVQSQLAKPLRWEKSLKIFIQSMGDLFHDRVNFDWIAAIFGVMAFCQNHTFLVLTKRPERMLHFFEYFHEGDYGRNLNWWQNEACLHLPEKATTGIRLRPRPKTHPLPNVWLGVTVCSPSEKSKIDILRQIPASIRFISFEPLLEDMGEIDLEGIGQCIVGGETGPGARPIKRRWIREIRDQCVSAGIPFFFKRYGNWWDKHRFPGDFPDDHGRLLDGKQWNQYPPKEAGCDR